MERSPRSSILWFYVVVGVYFVAGAVLDLGFFLTVWKIIVPWVQVIIGVVGILATLFLFMAMARAPRKGVERTILLLVGLTAFAMGIGGMMMGLIEFFTGDETFTHSALSVANIAPPIGFLVASITGVTAIALLIRHSYAILSKRQLLVSLIISGAILVVFGVIFFTPITGIQLSGVVKIAAIFFSLVCLLGLVGTLFTIMAFGKGRGRDYLINLILGLMFIAISGLAAFFCYATGGNWVGLSLLGFSVAEAFLALAGIRRWQSLVRSK